MTDDVSFFFVDLLSKPMFAFKNVLGPQITVLRCGTFLVLCNYRDGRVWGTVCGIFQQRKAMSQGIQP